MLRFRPGDFLIFQLEAGFALLRVLEIEGPDGANTWHLATYNDLFPDVETAEQATADSSLLTYSHPHIALTTRAFESTEVAKISHLPISENDLEPCKQWKADPNRVVADRSVRLMLGLR